MGKEASEPLLLLGSTGISEGQEVWLGRQRTISFPFALLSHPFWSLHSHTGGQGRARVGWGASSARRRTLGALPGGARVSICAITAQECSWGSSHGAPSSGWDPLLGWTIRITLGKILIIVASKAPLPADAGPCPGSSNNQRLWHFSHPRLESPVGRVIPVPSLDESTSWNPAWDPQVPGGWWGLGQSWGVCVGGECKVTTRRIGKFPGKENKHGLSELI